MNYKIWTEEDISFNRKYKYLVTHLTLILLSSHSFLMMSSYCFVFIAYFLTFTNLASPLQPLEIRDYFNNPFAKDMPWDLEDDKYRTAMLGWCGCCWITWVICQLNGPPPPQHPHSVKCKNMKHHKGIHVINLEGPSQNWTILNKPWLLHPWKPELFCASLFS